MGTLPPRLNSAVDPARPGSPDVSDYSPSDPLRFNSAPSLKMSDHCAVIAKKANQRANLILRAFRTHNPHIYSRAFKVYVSPIVEYASEIWNPYLQKDVELIENVQRVFSRRVFRRCCVRKCRYEDRLSVLNMHLLETRRLCSDLYMTFKIPLCTPMRGRPAAAERPPSGRILVGHASG